MSQASLGWSQGPVSKCLPRALHFSGLSTSSLPPLPWLKCILVITSLITAKAICLHAPAKTSLLPCRDSCSSAQRMRGHRYRCKPWSSQKPRPWGHNTHGGGGQVTGNLPSRILQVQGSKADPAPWPPDWFGQALSVQKAQVCPTHPGLASAALGALGSQCSQGEETSWTTLKA